MAYVPGYQHDVFVSYAHGDDREWISRLVQQLNSALDRRLGTKTSVWLDEDDNRKTRDFSREIPESAKASAVFLLLPSPTYIRSAYCVEQECRVFAETLDARRARFALPAFSNELFAARCPILPVDGNDHWSLFPGLTDIPFCSESGTFTNRQRRVRQEFRPARRGARGSVEADAEPQHVGLPVPGDSRARSGRRAQRAARGTDGAELSPLA